LAKFDDQILILGYLNSNSMRTDLFLQKELIYLTKGNLLYSDELEGTDNPRKQTNEIFVENPTTVNLVNALKVSGRTKNGLE
jgi:hypothetical protein